MRNFQELGEFGRVLASHLTLPSRNEWRIRSTAQVPRFHGLTEPQTFKGLLAAAPGSAASRKRVTNAKYLGSPSYRAPRTRVAVGNTQVKVYHKLVSSPGMRYADLGPDYYERRRDIRRQIAITSAASATSVFEVTLCRIPDPEPAGPGNTQAA